MTAPPRRPVLHLKNPPARPQTASLDVGWRCKPCGASVEIGATLDGQDEVRCPSCNASLGRAEQFRSDPPQFQRVRARRVIVGSPL
ncbi:MAG: hypothetical protein E8A12_07770 [Phenylobacterium sp.]|nr:MAG: hypothetical protein E8A12_07770 [Phenylobacterium sp.]